jgi:hypothetical protein
MNKKRVYERLMELKKEYMQLEKRQEEILEEGIPLFKAWGSGEGYNEQRIKSNARNVTKRHNG